MNFKMDIGVIVFLFVILCICQASFVISNSVFTILTTACGLVALWKCYDLVVSSSFILKEHKWLLLACNYTFFYLSISLSFLKLLNFGVEVFNDYLEQFHIALQLVYFALWGKRFREHGVTLG